MLAASGGDGEHPGDEAGVLGVAERRVVEQRADGSQTSVPGAGAVVALLFQVVQEGPDDGGVEVCQVQPQGSLPVRSRTNRSSSRQASR